MAYFWAARAMKIRQRETFSRWACALLTRSSITSSSSAPSHASPESASSATHWEDWSSEQPCLTLKNTRTSSTRTFLYPHHIWDTCTTIISSSMLACGSWRNGESQYHWRSWAWAMPRMLKTRACTSWAHLRAWSGSRMLFWYAHGRINTLHLTQQESRFAKAVKMINIKVRNTVRWPRIFWAIWNQRCCSDWI